MHSILNHEICKGINLTLNLQETEDFILRILSKAFNKEIYFRTTVKDSLYYPEETEILSESFIESDNNFYNNKYNYMDKTVIFLNNNYILLENWDLEKLKLWKSAIVNEISRRRLIHHENILLEQTNNSNNEVPLEQTNPNTSRDSFQENTMINNTSTDENQIKEQNTIKSDDEDCSDSISINSDILEPRSVIFQNELNNEQNYGEISGISTSRESSGLVRGSSHSEQIRSPQALFPGTESPKKTDESAREESSSVNNQNNNLFSSIFNSQFLNMSENINLSDSYINNIIENCKNIL